jgi:PAS domain S-box-containing protein
MNLEINNMISSLEKEEWFSTIDGVIIISSERKIITLNNSAEEITGFTEQDLINKNYDILFKNDKKSITYIDDALIYGKIFSNLSMAIGTANGSSKNIITSIIPIKYSDKEIEGVAFVFSDMDKVNEIVRSLQAMNNEVIEEKNKLEAIFHSRSEGTFTIDRDWTVTSFNRAAEKITGFTQQEAVGLKCWEIFQSRLCRKGCHMEITMSKKRVSSESEILISHKSGKQVPIRVHSAPLFNAQHKYIGGIETFRDITEIKNLRKQLEERFRFENLVGGSKAMQKVYVLLENVAQSDSTVLITGESGTGKELVARAIHINSERKNKPFIVVNCSAFAETLLESELFGHERGAFTGAIKTKQGHLELAHGGTLFLDEIGDISLPVQVKLLRVLERKQFERVGGTKTINMDVRIICATNKNLHEDVKKRRFREDLYYRINVFNIHLPPLRERMDDLPLLLDYILAKLRLKFKNNVQSISPATYNLLENHNWPGNIRELENVLEHAFVLCHSRTIQPEHLPEWLLNLDKSQEKYSDKGESNYSLKDAEKKVLISKLEQFKGNRGKTAQALGIDRSTLWRKMKKLKII